MKTYLLLLGAISLAYSGVILAPQTVNPDAYFILPYLERIPSLGTYLSDLFAFRTIDFQPVRDLTLYIDWMLFRTFNLNTFVLQNVLWWSGCCYLVVLLLRKLRPGPDDGLPLYAGLFYAVFPVFAGIVSWGIARKHLQAHYFSLLCTWYLLSYLESGRRRDLVKLNASYLLGVLSQPICILWPCWAILYVGLKEKAKFASFLRRSIPTAVIFVLTFAANYAYYSRSEWYNFTFRSKTIDGLQWSAKLYALGHYLFQMTTPYRLSIVYSHTAWRTLLGYGYILLILVLFFVLKKGRRDLILWLSFILLPLLIILNTPNLLLDPYVTIPSFGLLMLLVILLESNRRAAKLFFALLVLPLGFQTAKTASTWANEIDHARTNFTNSPVCVTALKYARVHFNLGLKMPEESRAYIVREGCQKAESEFFTYDLKVFISQAIYHSDDRMDYPSQAWLLQDVDKDFFYSNLILAALHVKNGQYAKARSVLDEVTVKNGGINLGYGASDYIIATKLHPFCERIGHVGCLRLTAQVSLKRNAPYY